MRERTAARFPMHGSNAIGLGRDFFRRFLNRVKIQIEQLYFFISFAYAAAYEFEEYTLNPEMNRAIIP